MSRKLSAPINIPTNLDPQLRSALDAIKESLEVTVGQRGDPLDRAPSIRELMGTGTLTADMYRAGSLRPPSERTDFSPDTEWTGPLPPPSNVTVTGTATAISVRWEIAPGAASAIAYTEIWAQTVAEFGDELPPANVESAELVAISSFVRVSITSQSNRAWRFFVRFRGYQEQVSPWHSINGTTFTTGRLAADVAKEVEGVLSEIHLDSVLQNRVKLIDGPVELAGSVAAQVTAEATARVEAVAGEATDRAAAIKAEAELRLEGLNNEASNRASDFQQEVTDRTAAIEAETDARVDAIQAEVDNRTAAISAESQIRESTDSLQALQQDVIAAAYNTNAATMFSISEINIDDRQSFARVTDALSVRANENEAQIIDESVTRADQDSALSTQIGILSARLDSRPTYASGFEFGSDFDRWVVTDGNTLTADSADPYAGFDAGLATSTETAAVASATSAPTGIHALIGSATASEFLGRSVQVQIFAKQPATGAAAEFAVAYVINGKATSGWQYFTPGTAWASHAFDFDVPADTELDDHYVVIWGDTSGAGNGVLLDNLLVATSAGDIPEITAAIEEANTARVNADNVLAGKITNIESLFNTDVDGVLNYANILDEAVTKVDADSATATKVSELEAFFSTSDPNVLSTAGILEDAVTKVDAESATAQKTSEIEALFQRDDLDVLNYGNILEDAVVKVDAESATAQKTNSLSALFQVPEGTVDADGNPVLRSYAGILDDAVAKVDEDSATASTTSDLVAEVEGNRALISEESEVRASEDLQSARITNLLHAAGAASSSTTFGMQTARASENEATALRLNILQAEVEDPDTGLSARATSTQMTSLGTTLGVDPDTGEMTASGYAKQLDNLRLELESPATDESSYGAISQLSDIQGDVEDLKAEWAIEVDVNDIISSISLRSDGKVSSIQMLADTYALWDPGPNYGAADEGKDPSDKKLVLGYATVDGESLLSLGNVFIDGTATMDAAVINGMLTAGEIDVPGAISGETITGTTLEGGSIHIGANGLFGPGGNWKTYIDSDGNIQTAGNILSTGNLTINGQFKVESSPTGERMEITDQHIRVYDTSGVLRVQMGALV